ncbi:TonB-dependent receptor [Oceanobacter sp. 5_MG-2023]|uniref:TonB-dependent receptor plug domain-containing protein n=1 Tax=Oceanobacter sp. 5_MG-2023 TaxID=3062645 RepID=UPI0026E27644|nr:TonB-dependent receptor [Oceanobacter sp. 5_MG-2023]MDO6681608.1 TonB-dependent receptor [Oceanobacter sp. 5_MG-2023]
MKALSSSRLLPFVATMFASPLVVAATQDEFSEPSLADDPDIEVVEVLGVTEPITSVSPRKLLRVPGAGNDPLQAIESLPGVVFSGGRESAPAVRGSSPDDNAYYIDFFPVGYIFHSDSSSILNDNVIDGFILEAAAFGPEYNGSTAAVIDASSRSPDFATPQAVIDVSLLKAGLFIEQPINSEQGFYLSGRQSLFQYYIDALLDDEDFQFTTLPEYYDYQGKYEYQPSLTESLVVQVIGSRDKAGLKFDEDSDELAQDPGLEGGISSERYFNSQAIVWDKFYGNGLQHQSGLSQLEEKFQLTIGQGNFVDVKTNDYILRSQFSQPLGINHYLHWGAELSESHASIKGSYSGPPCDEYNPDCRLVDGEETVTLHENIVITSVNLNVADSWQATDNWTITPGVLVAQEDYTDELFIEPKLSTEWQVAPGWNLTAAYGRYHNFPDNFGQYAKNFGNPDLKLETATHYETGIEHELRDDLLIRLEGYYKTMQRLVIARADQQTVYPDLSDEEYLDLPRYTNDASGEAWGMELFINKDLSEQWYGWASVAWSRTRRTNELTNEDFRYSYDQPLIVNLVASYDYSDVLSLGFKWRYQSGQLVTPIIGAEQDANDPELYNPIYGALNSERLPAYHALDVRADRNFFYSHWEMTLYGEILNLYGRNNVTGYRYKNADYSEREDVTDLPTIVSLGVKIRL